MLAFVAFVVGAVCFFLAAAVTTDITHLIEWGLCAVAVGLALAQLPYGPRWPNRGP